jgi:hypothetical protein
LEHFRCEWEYQSSLPHESDSGYDRSKSKERELCDTLLKESYWEVEGKVFCERHAAASGVVTTPEREMSWASVDFHDLYGQGGSEAEDEQQQINEDPGGGVLYSAIPPLATNGNGMTKAQKRTTRYMDLANNRI